MSEFPNQSKQKPGRIPYEDKALEYLYQINFERGFVQGKAEAKRENIRIVAKLMKTDGMLIEKINYYTGLSISEIDEL